MPIVNQATGMKYDFSAGSCDERTLFRVTPLMNIGSSSKMYFDTREQYIAWRQDKLDKEKSLRDLGIYIVPGLAAKRT